MLRAAVLLLLLALAPVPAGAADIRFATSNIADFWHAPGVNLRPARDGGPGLIRLDVDWD